MLLRNRTHYCYNDEQPVFECQLEDKPSNYSINFTRYILPTAVTVGTTVNLYFSYKSGFLKNVADSAFSFATKNSGMFSEATSAAFSLDLLSLTGCFISFDLSILSHSFQLFKNNPVSTVALTINYKLATDFFYDPDYFYKNNFSDIASDYIQKPLNLAKHVTAIGLYYPYIGFTFLADQYFTSQSEDATKEITNQTPSQYLSRQITEEQIAFAHAFISYSKYILENNYKNADMVWGVYQPSNHWDLIDESQIILRYDFDINRKEQLYQETIIPSHNLLKARLQSSYSSESIYSYQIDILVQYLCNKNVDFSIKNREGSDLIMLILDEAKCCHQSIFDSIKQCLRSYPYVKNPEITEEHLDFIIDLPNSEEIKSSLMQLSGDVNLN